MHGIHLWLGNHHKGAREIIQPWRSNFFIKCSGSRTLRLTHSCFSTSDLNSQNPGKLKAKPNTGNSYSHKIPSHQPPATMCLLVNRNMIHKCRHYRQTSSKLDKSGCRAGKNKKPCGKQVSQASASWFSLESTCTYCNGGSMNGLFYSPVMGG